MTVLAKSVEVLECSTWRTRRNVEVTHIDIIKGSLGSTSATTFTLQPSYAEHEFMQKSGYTQYCYTTIIKHVHKIGNVTVFYSDSDFQGEPMIEIGKFIMTDEQLQEWCNANQFIKFRIGTKELKQDKVLSDDEWWNF